MLNLSPQNKAEVSSHNLSSLLRVESKKSSRKLITAVSILFGVMFVYSYHGPKTSNQWEKSLRFDQNNVLKP